MCVRREASATDMGTLWCGAACDAIFSPVFHASAGASRHSTGLTRRAQQAANMVISQFCRRCASVARAASAADLARIGVLQDVMPSSCLCSMAAQRQPARHQSSGIHSHFLLQVPPATEHRHLHGHGTVTAGRGREVRVGISPWVIPGERCPNAEGVVWCGLVIRV